MTRRPFRPRWLVAVFGALVALSSCFADRGPTGGKPTSRGGNGSGGEPVLVGGEAGSPPAAMCFARPVDEEAGCSPVDSAEPLHLRLVEDKPQDRVVFVDDLFTQFKAHCGACHVDTNLGDTPFQADLLNFSRNVERRALDAMKSNVEECNDQAGCINYMPPPSSNGKPWSEREGDEADPIRLFATQLEEWLNQGSPADYFVLPASKGGTSPYPVDEAFAATMTNIGNCIPDAALVATEPSEGCEFDDRFAAMKRKADAATLHERIGLPQTLDQTDLFTFDSAELARYGVVAYAPTYPLWTDDAGKLRHIRVPRGTSVTFDRATKHFDIPKNTRFYKTFLKEVTALDGQKRYRKIETRLIVSREGEASLFGTYEWNDEETQATLVTAPLRSGAPFTDVLKTLVIDEPKAAELKALKDAGEIRNLTYELDKAHAVRRYAIPGSERCIQCHQGNQQFILGFSPLQVNRRPCTQETLDADGSCAGGMIEPAGESEVSQLQRLIDYGVISDFDPDADLVLLEDPQGGEEQPRPHRNQEEVVAQAYLLGNCSHCHNPIGYPTRQNPELGELLDFLPGPAGGIFQFPLERYSPRIKRGSGGSVSLPYITPSLRDLIPPFGASNYRAKTETFESGDPEAPPIVKYIEAPWRSLLYRNVDAPFTYSEDFAIYPHMPLNSPGFDCRAPRVLGEWMVSIPSKKKHPELNEELPSNDPTAEKDPQSYVEVLPEDPGYLNALAQAEKRLDTYKKGSRYASYCPDTSDIVDIEVLRGARIVPADGSVKGLPNDSVPDRPHWVVTDLSEAPGAWSPRRTDWKKVLSEGLGEYMGLPPSDAGYGVAKAAHDAERQVVSLLGSLEVSSALRSFAQRKLAFGLWQEKPECADKLQGQPKMADFRPAATRAADRMVWMEVIDRENLMPTKPVFESLPGAAIYNMICVNCHGTNADSKGRQASTLQDMTGGTGRVANFRDGFFGPAGTGGDNRERVFGSESMAGRYLPWMALGGTKTRIPQAILDLVANTEVLGRRRDRIDARVTSANMLQVAQNLCGGVARRSAGDGTNTFGSVSTLYDTRNDYSGLIEENGDAELWETLCAIDNPHAIRAFSVSFSTSYRLRMTLDQLYWPQSYPPNARVGDEKGKAMPSLSSDNRMPWCVVQPSDAEGVAWLATQTTADGSALPVCPAEFVVPANQYVAVGSPRDYVDITRWATRGAINAGLAVFLYLEAFIGQDQAIAPRYNECELLP